MGQPLVSVVTPFYNPEPYFHECVDSVLAQTYENFEYILVDNRSTDGAAAVADEYAKRDPRVRVVHNADFLSQLANHNECFKHISAESKYCKVLQADDWLFPTCLEEMVKVAEASPTIGLVSAYTLLETEVYLTGLPFPSRFIPGRDICRRYLLEGLNVFGSPTASMIRSDIVRDAGEFYDEASLIADLQACFKVLKNSDFGFVNQVLTFTRRNNVSAMTSLKPFGIGIVSHPVILRMFGHDFLTDAEFETRLLQVDNNEYDFLADGWLKRRPRAFWDFHQRSLALVGCQISKPRLYRHILKRLCMRLANAQDTLQAVTQKIGRSQ